MALEIRVLPGADILASLEAVAGLRIEVFREWPYLYDGSVAYERTYLRTYAESDRAVLVGAFDGAELVGVATGTPMEDHAQAFAAPLAVAGIPIEEVFYCAESVLRAGYRGQGAGYRFFDLREAHARALGRRYSVFCSVVRPADHPARPAGYRPLDPFWEKRGYEKIPGAFAEFSWLDVGKVESDTKRLQLWMRRL